jgi:HAD superfamily hydrolase (TIGR01509 family)
MYIHCKHALKKETLGQAFGQSIIFLYNCAMKTILVDAVHCFVSIEGHIFEDMYALLETYPNKKILTTGANDNEFKKFGLDKMPYEVFRLSHNPEKTDPRYYETLLSRFNLKKEEAIYFEHNPQAVTSAQSVGIKTYFYDKEKKDLKGLKAFLDSNL